MQQNGTMQILMLFYAIILYCSIIPGGQAWTAEVSEHNEFSQKTSEWPQMSASRKEILQYVRSLLLLNQRLADIQDGDNLQPGLEEDPSDSKQIRFPANRNRRLRAVKRQRPCFWSVVTCY